MHDMIRGRTYRAPLAAPSLSQHPPQMHLIASKLVESSDGYNHGSNSASVQLDLELRLPRPAVGVLNVTGPVQAWRQGSFQAPEKQVLPFVHNIQLHLLCKQWSRCGVSFTLLLSFLIWVFM